MLVIMYRVSSVLKSYCDNNWNLENVNIKWPKAHKYKKLKFHREFTYWPPFILFKNNPIFIPFPPQVNTFFLDTVVIVCYSDHLV